MKSQKLLRYQYQHLKKQMMCLCLLRHLLLRICWQKTPLKAHHRRSLGKMEHQLLHHSLLQILTQLPSLGLEEHKLLVNFLYQSLLQFYPMKTKNRMNFLNKKNQKKMKKRRNLRHLLDFLEHQYQQILSKLKARLNNNHHQQSVTCLERPHNQFLR